MRQLPKWLTSGLAVAVLVAWTAPISAADLVAGRGKIKSVAADKNALVLTGLDGKEFTLHMEAGTRIFAGDIKGANVGDLKAGDDLSMLYAKGTLSNTAKYIAVNSPQNKDMEVGCGTLKSIDAGNKVMVVTNTQGQDLTYHFPALDKVHLNSKESAVGELKAGDKVCTASVQKDGSREVKDICAERK